MIILMELTINGNKYEEVISMDDINHDNESPYKDIIHNLVEKNLNTTEDNMFYYDTDKFIEENVLIKINKREKANLYSIIVSEYQGYDSYDSAIICEYTEDRAKKIALYELGSYFHDAIIKRIGKAEKDINTGVIVSSFNAG